MECIAVIMLLLVFFGVASVRRPEDTLHEEKASDDPCDESCLRWSECNGVDDQCPWRK